MKNNLVKTLSILMCLVLFITMFAACKKKPAADETTTELTEGYSIITEDPVVELTSDELVELVKDILGDDAKNFDGDLSKLDADKLAKVKTEAAGKGYNYDENLGTFTKIMRSDFLESLSEDELKALAKKALGAEADKFDGNLSSLTEAQRKKLEKTARDQGYYVSVNENTVKKEVVATDEQINEVIESVLGEEATTFKGNLDSLSDSQKEQIEEGLADVNAKQDKVDEYWSENYSDADSPEVATTVPNTTSGTTSITVITNPATNPAATTPTKPPETKKTTTTKLNFKVFESISASCVSNYQYKKDGSYISTTFSKVEPTTDGGAVAIGGAVAGTEIVGVIVKYDATGKKVWESALKGNDMVGVEDVTILNDGYIVVTGYTTSSDLGITRYGDMFLDGFYAKFNPTSGKLEWIKPLGGTQDDYPSSIAAAADGGFYIGGRTSSTDNDFAFLAPAEGQQAAKNCGFILKFDKSGNPIPSWRSVVKTTNSCKCDDIDVDAKGDVFAIFNCKSADGDLAKFKSGSNNGVYLVKYNPSNASKTFEKFIWGAGATEATAVCARDDGGCAVLGILASKSIENEGTFAGTYNAGSGGTTDVFVKSYKTDGSDGLLTLLGGFESDRAGDITMSNGNYIVTGYTQSTNRDFAGMPGAGNNDGFVYVIGPTGTKSVYSGIGGSNADIIRGICKLNNGSIFAVGNTASADGAFAGKAPTGTSTKPAAVLYSIKLTEKTR